MGFSSFAIRWPIVLVALVCNSANGVGLFGQSHAEILPNKTLFFGESENFGENITTFLRIRNETGLYRPALAVGQDNPDNKRSAIDDIFSLDSQFFGQLNTEFEIIDTVGDDNEPMASIWTTLFPGRAFYALVEVGYSVPVVDFSGSWDHKNPGIASDMGLVSVFGFETGGFDWLGELQNWAGDNDGERIVPEFEMGGIRICKVGITGLYFFQHDGWFYGSYSRELIVRLIQGLQGARDVKSLSDSRLYKRLSQRRLENSSMHVFVQTARLQARARAIYRLNISGVRPKVLSPHRISTLGTAVSFRFDDADQEAPIAFRVTRAVELPPDSKDQFIDQLEAIDLDIEFPFPSETSWLVRLRDPAGVLAENTIDAMFRNHHYNLLMAPYSFLDGFPKGFQPDSLRLNLNSQLTGFSGGLFHERGKDSFSGMFAIPGPFKSKDEVEEKSAERMADQQIVEEELSGIPVLKEVWGGRQFDFGNLKMNFWESSSGPDKMRWSLSFSKAILNDNSPNPDFSFSWLDKANIASEGNRDLVIAEISMAELPTLRNLLELDMPEILCGHPLVGPFDGMTTKTQWMRFNGHDDFSFFEEFWFRLRYQLANCRASIREGEDGPKAGMYALHYRLEGLGIWETDGWVRRLSSGEIR